MTTKRKGNVKGNGSSAVGLQLDSSGNAKRLGGVTGKGFLPGRSGNPSGRRKGSVSLTVALKNLLAKGVNADDLAKSIYAGAMKGDAALVRVILDRVDGVLSQQVNNHLSGSIVTPVSNPAVISIVLPDNGRSALPHSGDYPTSITQEAQPAKALPAPKAIVNLPPKAALPESAPPPPEPASKPAAMDPRLDPASPQYVPSCFRSGPGWPKGCNTF